MQGLQDYKRLKGKKKTALVALDENTVVLSVKRHRAEDGEPDAPVRMNLEVKQLEGVIAKRKEELASIEELLADVKVELARK